MIQQPRIEAVRIAGFRSLSDVNLSDLGGLTVLIGANGSGKSNIIRFFDMMSWMLRSHRLAEFIERQGGADDQLFQGSQSTPRVEAEIALRTDQGRNEYRFILTHAHPDRFIFTEEAFRFSRADWLTEARWQYLGSGHGEAQIVKTTQRGYYASVNVTTARVILNLLRDCAVYQFHDTSDHSVIKMSWDASDNYRLRSHGGNLAAVLLRLERIDFTRFDLICRHIARVLPVFDRFILEESYDKVTLRWKAKGTDKTFGAHLTSDGSLRFFALVTLLNLPPEMLPSVVLLDEPELGLHPAAISLVGAMIQTLANERQVILATQSPLLVDAVQLDQIVVLDLVDGATTLRQLDPDAYRTWLDEGYAPGELWLKNLIGGRP